VLVWSGFSIDCFNSVCACVPQLMCYSATLGETTHTTSLLPFSVVVSKTQAVRARCAADVLFCFPSREKQGCTHDVVPFQLLDCFQMEYCAQTSITVTFLQRFPWGVWNTVTFRNEQKAFFLHNPCPTGARTDLTFQYAQERAAVKVCSVCFTSLRIVSCWSVMSEVCTSCV